MSIAKAVYRWERIVPVRFARAPDPDDPGVDSGPLDQQAPDPDDRGFISWSAHGVTHPAGSATLPIGFDAAVELENQPSTRLRLIREDIDDNASLFVTTNPAGIVAIVTPASAPAALPATTEMMIKVKAQQGGTTHLEIHFGSESGPVIHRLEVIVNPLINVRVTAHVPTIRGTPFQDTHGNTVPAVSNRSDAGIFAFLKNVNAIFFPYGVRLRPDAAVDRPAHPLTFARQGAVDADNDEFFRTTAFRRVAHSINAHFVPQLVGFSDTPPIGADQIGGVGVSLVLEPDRFGLIVADWPDAHAVAHEVGHVLNLINDPTGQFVHANTFDDPSRPGTGRVVRDDIVTRRRLMYAFTSFGGPNVNHPYRDDVGYGADVVGDMLTVKQFNNDNSDLEMHEVQRSAGRI
ncbi:MAG: hypothetical protein ACRD3D_07010 [Terriglobia bacterium]